MTNRGKGFGSAMLIALLAGCGGGGGGSNNGGTTSGLLTNTASIGVASLSPGQTTALISHAIIRGAAPTGMTWTVTPVTAVGAADPAPQVADANCAAATFSPPAVAGTTSGEGVCQTIVTIPVGAKTGTWRLINTATSASSGSVAGSVDLNIVGTTSGFALVQPSVPLTAYANSPLLMNVPFSVTPGAVVSGVTYTWTPAAANPAGAAFAGGTTSTPTFIPATAGVYTFAVQANARVNNIPEVANGTVVVSVAAPQVIDSISAGIVQTVVPGDATILFGSIKNKDTTSQYAESWTQLPGVAGGPVAITLSGANTGVASFVAPTTPGTYNFRYQVVKTMAGGAQTITTDQTSVVVTATTTSTFQVSAGNVQSVLPNVAVVLQGTVTGTATGASTSYSWTQVGGTPAVVTLNNANSQSASFIPTTVGTYTFDLTVAQTQSGITTTVSGRTQVVVSAAPTGSIVVSAGNIQSVTVATPTTLTGTVTGAVTGTTYTYAWTQVGVLPAAVTLANGNTLIASFVPNVAGTYTFDLTVTATTGAVVTTSTARTQVVATSGAGGAAATFALTANAGAAQSATLNAVTTLNGGQTVQGSSTGVTYAYAWAQDVANPAVIALSNAASAMPTFIPTVAGSYTFTLTVTATLPDASTRVATSTTQVLVGGAGNAFSVSAGDAQVGAINTALTLPGVITTQGTYAGATFAYAWAQVGAVPAVVTISNPTSLTASFIPTIAGTYTFSLTVTVTQGALVTTQTSQTQVLAQ